MDTRSPIISVVIPIYGCKACMIELCQRIIRTIEAIPAQPDILLVNDASPDLPWSTIQQLHAQDPRIKGIDLARNFGQHHAITAGLDYAEGDWIVVMDCDLQDTPEEISQLYQKACEGYEVVFATRTKRHDPWLKKKASQLFYWIYNLFTGWDYDHSIANFSISSKQVITGYRAMREQNRLFPLFIQWMGFKTTTVDVKHNKRKHGKTSYNLQRLVKLGTEAIIAQSNKPLRLSIQFGLAISLVSLLFAVYFFARYFFLDMPTQGWTSVIVSLYFIGGLILFNIGILGLYIGKVFNETKNRPLYLIRQTTDASKEGVD